MIQPAFQKMSTPICSNNFSRASLFPNSRQYFLVLVLFLGSLGQKLGAVVRFHLLTLRYPVMIYFSGYPHSADGTLSKMVQRECEATRTIFVPEDSHIRMACVIMELSDPHTHPILPATKAALGIKNMYRECIVAAGVHGKTVQTVDNGE